jgi:hypothetical protein
MAGEEHWGKEVNTGQWIRAVGERWYEMISITLAVYKYRLVGSSGGVGVLRM